MDVREDVLDRLRAALDKLRPHKHGKGMNECHVCDQNIIEAAVEVLKKTDEAIRLIVASALDEQAKVSEQMEALRTAVEQARAGALEEAVQMVAVFLCHTSERREIGRRLVAAIRALGPAPKVTD